MQTNHNPTLQIKATFGTEIRRCHFEGSSFADLKKKLAELFQIEQNLFTLTYLDDEGDRITVSSDPELHFAISLFSGKILRFQLQEKVENPWSDPKWRNDGVLASWRDKRHDRTSVPLGKWAARFIRHVTIEDDCILSPQQHFVKVWRFRNEGHFAWPPRCVILFVGKQGDQLGGPDARVVNETEVMPGQEIDVSVPLVAPSKAGTYVGYWRLAHSVGGKKFGQRVRVQIQVREGGTQTPVAPLEEPIQWKATKMEAQPQSSTQVSRLGSYVPTISEEMEIPGSGEQVLQNLGFTDGTLNTRLLAKHDGDVHSVIGELLQSETLQESPF